MKKQEYLNICAFHNRNFKYLSQLMTSRLFENCFSDPQNCIFVQLVKVAPVISYLNDYSFLNLNKIAMDIRYHTVT